MKSVKVLLTFIEPMLGTLPADEQIYRDYIASKNPNKTAQIIEQEVAALSEEAAEEQTEA